MWTRRQLLASIPALSAARAFAQPPATEKPAAKPVAVTRLNQITLSVSDLKRSITFYQGLFGLPMLTAQGPGARLRIGSGPQTILLVESKESKPSISQFGMAVDKFDAAAVARQLEDLGVGKASGPGAPSTAWMTTRGETPELFLADPDNLIVQLQDSGYCGGAGPLGARCSWQIAPRRGLLMPRDLSHFTIRVANAQRSRDFYQHTFGMAIQAYQGENSPILGVGSSRHFVMSIPAGGGRGATPSNAAPNASNPAAPPAANPPAAAPAARPAAIDHGCFLVEAFDVDRIFKALADFGLKPRGEAAGPAGPLVYYVSLRMPNRGGAAGGTPELYFTDPDGIVLQLQDVSYCGGGGALGSVCL